MVQAYLGLEAILVIGNSNYKKPIKIIDSIEGITVTKISPIYETAPVGYTEQPNF